MTISSISGLLALPWSHAYCTEGSRFGSSAVFGSIGATWRVGVMAIGGGTTTLQTWPDEIASADLTQATSSKQPYYSPASTLNAKPSVYAPADGVHRWLEGTFATSMGTSSEIVAVGRLLNAGGNNVQFNSSSFNTVYRITTTATTPSHWQIAQGAGVNPSGGTPDTNPHMFRGVFSTILTLFVDEVSVASGGPLGSPTLPGIRAFDTTVESGVPGIELVFLGVATVSALSATNRSDMHTFFQSHYGTP